MSRKTSFSTSNLKASTRYTPALTAPLRDADDAAVGYRYVAFDGTTSASMPTERIN